MRSRLLVLSQVLVAGLVCVSTSAADGGVDLCGIAPPVDQILECKDQGTTSPPTPAAPASGGRNQPAGAAAAGAEATAEAQVRRVSPIPRYVPDLLLLKFKPGTSLERQRQVLQQAGVSVERQIGPIGAVVVRMPPQRRDAALAGLKASRWVARAEKDVIAEALATTPNDVDWDAQWGLRTINLPRAWDRTHGSSSVIVAVVDTGVDAKQPDLKGAVLPGFDLVNGDADPSDDHGHGTAVAGVIAARANNREGIAGVCWSCSILPVKVLDSEGLGDMGVIAAGIVRAVDAGAHVINLSLGGPGDDKTLDDAVAYAVKNGALVIAATGNNGTSAPFYPAATPGALSVAGTDASDHLYSWSNFGPWATIAAPGCNLATIRVKGYGTFCGTSSATPVVSGLAALALSAQPRATRDEILNALVQTTRPVGDGVARGRIDAAAALDALPQAAAPPAAPPQIATLALRGSLTTRASARTYRQAVADGSLTAMLTFPGAGRTLTLALRDSGGALVAQHAGSSPIRVAGRVRPGTVSLQVTGPRGKTPFTLRVAYPRAAAAAAEAPTGPSVVLSAIEQLPPGAVVHGPQVGAPVPGASLPDIIALGFSISDRSSAPFVAAINKARRARGLGPVALSPALSRAALAHVRALATAGRFSHDWEDGTPFPTWILRYYPPRPGGTWLAGENLLWAPADVAPADAVAAWIASPGHRRVLFTPNWRDLGVGIVAVKEAPGAYGGKDAFIVAADFGTRPQH